MTVEQALGSRFSCRCFLDTPVPQQLLERLFQAAFRSPSCENSQPWHLYVAGPEAMKQLCQQFEQNRKAKIRPDLDRRFDGTWTEEMRPCIDDYFNGIYDKEPRKNLDYTLQKRNLFYAPTMVFLCIDQQLPTWSVFDAGLFAQSFMLAATEQGLATIASAVSVSYPEAIRQTLHIPESDQILIGIGVGYLDLEHSINSFRTSRKPIDEVHYLP